MDILTWQCVVSSCIYHQLLSGVSSVWLLKSSVMTLKLYMLYFKNNRRAGWAQSKFQHKGSCCFNNERNSLQLTHIVLWSTHSPDQLQPCAYKTAVTTRDKTAVSLFISNECRETRRKREQSNSWQRDFSCLAKGENWAEFNLVQMSIDAA